MVPTYVQSKVKIKKKHAPILQKVTQHHEFVKKLVEECAYEENLAIKAVECTHAKSLSAALAFIDNHEEYSSHHLSEEVNHKDGESNINWLAQLLILYFNTLIVICLVDSMLILF